MLSTVLPWIPPLDLARSLPAEEPFTLLYSGAEAGELGRHSLLARHPLQTIESDDFNALATHLTAHRPCWENAWFGWLAYGLKDRLETLPTDAPGALTLPKLWMTRYAELFHFDHRTERLTAWSHHAPQWPACSPAPPPAAVSIRELGSNMSRAEYLRAAAHVIEAIRAGELYQANLTRKFFGRFASPPQDFALFERLNAVSPAAYSAFLRPHPGVCLLSSSPERFLAIHAGGAVATRPIKGSAARGTTPEEDAACREKLRTSAKDRAENLMIVDLMRNDLSRSCIPGSVRVESLFDVTAHPTVHHLSSAVSGQKRPDASALDVVKACFPPGSMTGAPKIRAMRLCTELEKVERGIYSGALGWFGGDGSLDLSVVIRTLIIEGDYFEFQVGGGIVADSTPEAEWRETLIKAAGLARALGIPMSALEAL